MLVRWGNTHMFDLQTKIILFEYYIISPVVGHSDLHCCGIRGINWEWASWIDTDYIDPHIWRRSSRWMNIGNNFRAFPYFPIGKYSRRIKLTNIEWRSGKWIPIPAHRAMRVLALTQPVIKSSASACAFIHIQNVIHIQMVNCFMGKPSCSLFSYLFRAAIDPKITNEKQTTHSAYKWLLPNALVEVEFYRCNSLSISIE